MSGRSYCINSVALCYQSGPGWLFGIEGMKSLGKGRLSLQKALFGPSFCCAVAKLCITLCDPMDCNLPGSSASPCFSFCLQSFPASESFLMSWLFASGSHSTGTSASASVLPKNIQGWFPFGLTSLISLLSKGISRVFSSTTVRKHLFFGTHSSLWSSSHIRT